MKIVAVFLDKNKNWKKVIMKGEGLYPNAYIWKNGVIKSPSDVANVDEYISMKKFFTETHLDMIIGEKEKLFRKIIKYIEPYNQLWVWVHRESNL